MASQTLIHPNSNNNIPKFQVSSILLTYLTTNKNLYSKQKIKRLLCFDNQQ